MSSRSLAVALVSWGILIVPTQQGVGAEKVGESGSTSPRSSLSAKPESTAGLTPGFAVAWFDDFYLHQSWPEEKDLLAILAPVAGQEARIEQAHWHEQRSCRLVGLWRLQTPWQPGTALRLWLVEREHGSIQIHFWAGQKGATFRYYPDFHQSWVAFMTQRTGNQPQPEMLAFCATDQGRYRRTGLGSVAIYWHGGRLSLVRGDVPLVSLPFAEQPQEVYLQGRAVVRGICMFPAADGPPKDSWAAGRWQADAGLLIDLPRLAWQTGPQEKARFRAFPDGSVEWSADARSGDVQAMAPIVPAGIYQWTFQVDEPQPGTGILWANARGEVQARLSFFRDRATGRTTFGLVPGWHREVDRQYEQRRPTPWIDSGRWFRLVHGAGVVKLFTSPDGQVWSQTEPEEVRISEPLTQIGLFCWDGQQARRIRLRNLSVERLEVLESFVQEEVRQKVTELLQKMDPNAAEAPWKASNLQEWDKRLEACRPPAVLPEEWRRAWMVYILTVGPIPGWGPQMLYQLARELVDQANQVDSGLRLLEQLGLLFPAASDWQAAEQWASCYERLARKAEDLQMSGAYPVFWRSFVLAPFWPQRDWPPVLERLIWYELVRGMSEERLTEVAALCRRLRFRARPEILLRREVPWKPQTEHLIRIAEDFCARRRLPVVPDRPLPEQSDYRPLLLEQWAREAYNVRGEWEAALANGQFREACLVLQGVSRAALEGLLPDSQDPQLLTSLAALAARTVEQSPALGRLMEEEFGGRGRLRLQQAIQAADPDGVEMITIQFPGTKAALEARRWLGDRALAAGRFAQAAGHYRQALLQAEPKQKEELQARLQLALALQGKRPSDSPVSSLLLDGQPGQAAVAAISVQNFPQLLEDLVRIRSVVQGWTSSADQMRCPPPPTLAKQNHATSPVSESGRLPVRQVLVAEGGSKKPDFVSATELDWAGRETTALLSEPLMVITSRCEHLAFDLIAGRIQWRHWRHLPSAARPWPLLATPPMMVKELVLIRRAIDGIHELAALERTSGRLLWSTTGDDYIASDALWADQAVWAFTVRAIEGQKNILSLLRLDPATGRIQRRFTLLEFRSLQEPAVWCQAALQDDRIVATAAGVVFCCDLGGRLAWVRRQTWLPAPGRGMYEARLWLLQKHSPPIIQERWLYATQPGVWNVEAIDLGTGRLRWRTNLSELVSLVGLLQGKLIVQTIEGLVALEAESGRVLWRHDTPARQEGLLCGPPGGLLYAKVISADPNPQQPKVCLVWLDPDRGVPLGEYSVQLPAEARPVVGPLLSDGQRLWLFYGKADDSATRTVFEVLLSPTETAPKETKRL
ncbi:MAG: PQQ-binding-like beta-propeller repeat protein [Thermoguttaceae bacterium]|nr:PQQ-binding-like beta-propeller repeat protein [Thermoguttaceae bacterium]